MRLAALIPTISPNLVSALEGCGIRTEVDLLFKSVVDVYRQLPPGTIALCDLEKTVAHISELTADPGISGRDLLQQEMQADKLAPALPSGIDDLDHLLGGFGGRRVIEISGDRRSGKTTLALNLVLRHLAEYSDRSVAWIDTTGDFSVEHAADILKVFQTEAAATALERLQISLAFDIDAAYNVLGELESLVSSNPLEEAPLSCIVIDAITPLLAPLLSAVSAHGHSIMTGFMYQLRSFSRNHSCTVLIINNTSFINSEAYSTVVPGSRKPALGPSFTFLTDATIWLSKLPSDTSAEQESAVRSAKVLRSKTLSAKKQSTFRIMQGVILGL